MVSLQKRTAAFLHAERVLQSRVPDEVFCAEQGLLREQFMDGSMDNELDVVLEEQPEDWSLHGLSSFTNILRRCEAHKAAEARKLQSQLAAKAAAANMDMLLADLKADDRDVQAYKAAADSAQKAHGRSVC